MQSKDSQFWLVILIILMLPLAFITPSTELSMEAKRRRLSNRIGLFVLFVLGLTIGLRLLAVQRENSRTKTLLTEVAQGFADHNETTMLHWARGKYTDAWGNCIILQENSEESGVSFVSKGRDGALGTKDDIVGERIQWSEKPIPKLNITKAPPKKKGVGTKVKETWGKVRGFFKDDE